MYKNGMAVSSKPGTPSTPRSSSPLSGIRLAVRISASIVESGSISITTESPSSITESGIVTFNDLSSEPSSISVGIGSDVPSISTEYVSSSST